MKGYKDFRVIELGFSDVASLVLRGCDNLGELKFGGDSDYRAYYVNEPAVIGAHYELAFSCHNWLWIYDDMARTVQINAKTINVYRAGEYGCIIEAIK